MRGLFSVVNLDEWEQQLRRRVAEIHHHGEQVAAKAAAVRGRGEVNGVQIEVDARGDITNFQIAPGAMRWSSNQLTVALLECHRKARADAKAKTNRAIDEADPRIRNQLEQTHAPESAPPPTRHSSPRTTSRPPPTSTSNAATSTADGPTVPELQHRAGKDQRGSPLCARRPIGITVSN
ncbi:hypothetical protein [Nocardia jiangxiensis]|uniref:hypothetical protein n=1 Tax=Nocardia jiangxiensis TaxID=282685 RepID=UPI001FE23C31|nr:hypothetical protein [Nocardia jiangxiensis]